ncbi:multidrug efflux pump subunit AcrB [Bradyrhizobium sp. F1.13.4]
MQRPACCRRRCLIRPTYAKVNPADAPVMTLALRSDTISLRAMSDIADTLLAQRLSQISGVGRVSVLGGLKPAVRIQADLARLAAYGIAMEDLRTAIANANVSGPKGSLDGAQQSYIIAANDQIAAADAYKPVIIAYRNGSPVTIADVAQIVDGLENDRTGGWYQGSPAVIIDVQRQPGANVIDVVSQIRAEIPKVQRAIPAGVNLTIVSDRTVTIRASVRDVQFTLILSVVLVTLVVLLFLRSLRATLIAGVALPLSLITSFGIMYFAGFSLDNLSLMALTIGTGFVVDDAIVMIENIVRHMENGDSAMEASLKGASEIGFTVISLTVSLIAVFIPLLFMSGLVGRMFREFALTLTIAVVTSAVVSLTLTPMMCSRLLKHAHEELAVPGLAAVSRFIDRTVEFYHRTLLWVLERQRATLVVTFATLIATLALYVVAPKGFLPLQDTASITAVTEAGPDVSFAEMQKRQAAAADAIKADPDVTGVVSVIGAGSVNPTTNVGRLVMTLKPRGERRERCQHRHQPAEGAGGRHPRHDGLLPAGAGRADLDPVEPLAISVHADRHRRRACVGMGAQAGCRDAARSAVPRRLLGGAGRRSPGAAHGRPYPRRPARRQPSGHHRHAQRRLRAAPDLDHLRPGQPVPRGAGSTADVPARSFDPVEALSAGRRERDRRRAQRTGAALRRWRR